MTYAEFLEFAELVIALIDLTPHERRRLTRCKVVASQIRWRHVAVLADEALGRDERGMKREGIPKPKSQNAYWGKRKAAA